MNERTNLWPLVAQQNDEGLRNQLTNLLEQADEASLKQFQAFLLFCLDRFNTDKSSAEIWKAWKEWQSKNNPQNPK